MPYHIELDRAAKRQLAELPKKFQRQVAERIDALAIDARPPGCQKLSGNSELYRIRSGDYRILYQIEDDRLVVLVVKIGHRRDVYRRTP